MSNKKRPDLTNLLTGEAIVGLPKRGVNPKMEYGDLFSTYSKGGYKQTPNKKMGVGQKISLLIKEGYPQDQAVAIAMDMYKKEKYPNGGEHTTPDFIEMPELVSPGSSRHRELQTQEKEYNRFVKQRDAYAPMIEQFGEPKVLSVEDFKKSYPQADEDFIPKGTKTVFGFTAEEGEGGFDNTPASPIYAETRGASTNRALNFFPGYEEVDRPSDYEVFDPYADIEMEVSPEEVIPQEAGKSTNKFRQKPGAWYKDAKGSWVLAPKEAEWREDTGTYYDASTGRIFNPYGDSGPSVSVDPDFVGSSEAGPSYDPTEGTMTTIAESGTPSFGEGGKFSEDYFKALGESLREVFQQGGSKEGPEVEELLTGEQVTGLDANKKVAPNAEVEDQEYVKFPDETTQKAVGDKHKDGGIEMHLPDGTKILSDKRTLNKDQAGTLRKEYGIKVSTKTTYAEALDKYVNKIGLRKLYDDQEQLFEELDKVLKNSMSEGSSRINKEYLSKKIHSIEKQKEDKEKLKTELFDKMFTMQEVGKRMDEKQEVEQFFEEGGISRSAFKKVVNKYGLSEKEGIDLYKGKIPERFYAGGEKKYPDGGEHREPKTLDEVQAMYEAGEITRAEADRYEVELANMAVKPPVTFTTTSGEHEFSNPKVYTREEQKAGEAAFGNITKETLPNVLNNLYRNFPDIVAEEYGVVYNDDGTVTFDESINFNQASDKVKHFQERSQKRMEDTANMIISNPESFSDEYVANAKNYLSNETFDESLARGIDSKLGNFTSGRYSLGINVVTPEEKQELERKGIFTTNQLQDAVDRGEVNLSTPSLDRLERLRSLTPQDADVDFTIDPIQAQPQETQEVVEQPEVLDPTRGITDDLVVPGREYPTLFASPDQAPLPPSAMEAHLLGRIRLQRIDPTRIGVETEIQTASDAVKEGVEALDHLPPNQRAAAIVAMQANAQKGINEAIHQANVVNAQNQASAELFNIGQAAQEEQASLNNLLSFEARQLTAKAKTEEEIRNYYKQLNKIAVNNFRNQQDLNMLQTLTPDYSINPSGLGIDFTPQGEFKLQDNSKFKALFS